ncbi:SEC-C motif-containing protein [Acidovorax sp. 107]|uniref:YchJ family protein n=1 Tax=Acidovorax sp. 107 TaxID=2135638 RepID=UPI000D37DDFE|nr:YchJ family metal-binding protein [Acidovorax sp. 107]PUA95223.1 SEC-C motif-containing protein [Acidovorax sp. 107]
MSLPRPTDPCPCGRPAPAGPGGSKGKSAAPLPFASCCGRYLAAPGVDAVAAPDAESLMRSRYTAFVCERADYLQATWHASTRPAALDFDAGAKWLGLDVRRHVITDAEHAVVEFVARYRVGGRAVRLHETSRFVREGGQWFYVDGDQQG